MIFINKFKVIKKFYIIFFVAILFFCALFNKELHADSFKINEIEVSEIYDLNFNKEKVFDKAFSKAYDELISKIIISQDKKKIEKVSLSIIKSLIDSFKISNEKFFKNKYYALVNVNFNKKKTYQFFESQNIFPSVPKKIDLLTIPVIINDKKKEIVIFEKNIFYKNWNENVKKSNLINHVMLSEDIEDVRIIKNKIDIIEKYDFNEIIKKYEMNNYIILIINKNINEVNILSKLMLNNDYKIFNKKYKNLNLNELESISKVIYELKTLYEDEWKRLNLINTSIKLPLTISLTSKDYKLIESFEKTLENLDPVSSYYIYYFNNENIIYKVIYNGPPNKFFIEIEEAGFDLEKNKKILKIK